MNRLAAFVEVQRSAAAERPRRGAGKQWALRDLEQQVRLDAVRLSSELREAAWTEVAIGAALGVLPRTLRQWEQQVRWGSVRLLALGRPAERSPRQQRQQVLDLLAETGPGLSVSVLRECFPVMARAELDDLLKRYRRWWRQENARVLRVLEWTRAGSVWTLDFTEPPQPVEGRWPWVLAVRDLGSGQQLLWQPLAEGTASAVLRMLEALIAEHGAPLVLKSDNGGAFRAALVQALLEREGVIPLFSPPYCPWYNGAIEASIGALKIRTERQALLHGRPGEWMLEDLEAARQEGNWVSRPWGEQGGSREECWQGRVRLTEQERKAFGASVARCRQEVREEWERSVEGLGQGGEDEGARERKAIQRALVEHGYLLFSRRRIPSPIPRPILTNIP